MTKHRWSEVLHAIADGKEVEYQSRDTWYLYSPVNCSSPLDTTSTEWRVKPEPATEYKYTISYKIRQRRYSLKAELTSSSDE